MYKVTARRHRELICTQRLAGGSGYFLGERKTGLERSTGVVMCLHESSTGRKMKNNGPLLAELAT